MRDIGLSVNERGNVLLEYHKLVEKLVDMSTLIDWVHIFIIYLQPVSYTHLTLPTICSV